MKPALTGGGGTWTQRLTLKWDKAGNLRNRCQVGDGDGDGVSGDCYYDGGDGMAIMIVIGTDSCDRYRCMYDVGGLGLLMVHPHFLA